MLASNGDWPFKSGWSSNCVGKLDMSPPTRTPTQLIETHVMSEYRPAELQRSALRGLKPSQTGLRLNS